MNAPQRDPLNDMFDQYAAATATETTRATPGQLRRRMHRHRAGRVAAAGVAAAVLAVPGGWMLQQAGAADEPTGAADQGTTADPGEEQTGCGALEIVVIPVEALPEYLTPGMELVHVVVPVDADMNAGMADPDDVNLLAVPEGASVDEYLEPDQIAVPVDLAEEDLEEFFGVDEEVTIGEVPPCEEEPTEESPTEQSTP